MHKRGRQRVLCISYAAKGAAIVTALVWVAVFNGGPLRCKFKLPISKLQIQIKMKTFAIMATVCSAPLERCMFSTILCWFFFFRLFHNIPCKYSMQCTIICVTRQRHGFSLECTQINTSLHAHSII